MSVAYRGHEHTVIISYHGLFNIVETGIFLLLKEYGKLYSVQSREYTSSNLTQLTLRITIDSRESEAGFVVRRIGTDLIRPTHGPS